jgi:hypothetical protein
MGRKKLGAWAIIGFLIISMGCITIIDDVQLEFDLGTYGAHTQWNAGPPARVELNAAGRVNGSGTYLSDIKDAQTVVGWESITWTEPMPYRTELPGGQMGDTSVNMSNNVLLLHLNEASGTLNDSSGQNNDGTSSGSPFYGAFGRYNTALGFDGVDDYVDVGNAASLQITTGTLEAWVKTPNAGASYRGILVREYHYSAFLYNNEFGLYDWNAVTWRGSGVYLNDDTWHHVVVTFQSGVVNGTTFYVDGVSAGTTTMTTVAGHDSEPVRVGTNEGAPATQAFAGTIDEVAIYGRILSADEVLTRYKRGVLEVALQGRSCATPCTVEPWSTSFYSPGSMLSPNLLSLPQARYFQYSIIFVTEDSSYTPEVQTVTVVYSVPEIYNVSITPSPTNCAAAATLNATADAEFPAALITSAEYYLDSNGPYPMSASDDLFDFITENVTATIDVTALASGDHTITIRGQDSRGLWSTFVSVTLTVSCGKVQTRPHETPSLLPLAHTNIGKAKEFLSQANDLLSQAREKGMDTAECEKLLTEATRLLDKASSSLTNPVYANNLALASIAKLKSAIECLKALQG